MGQWAGGDEDQGLAAPGTGERCRLVTRRERGAEHSIRAGFGWCDRAAVPDERRRRTERIEGVAHGEGTTQRRDNGETRAADRRAGTTRLLPPGRPDPEGAPGGSPEEGAAAARTPAPHEAGGGARFARHA